MANRNIEALTDPLYIGSGTNRTKFETDGTLEFEGDAIVYDDLVGQAIARNLDTSSGRIDFNYAEATVDFANNARFDPAEQLTLALQMSHSYKYGTAMKPHIHWFQNQNAVPNWLVEYRVIENGEAVTPTFTQVISLSQAFTYSTGNILQIAILPDITGVSTVSFAVDVKIYRDVSNASGLFAGADPYTGDASIKFFDIHYQINTIGSRQEYVK